MTHEEALKFIEDQVRSHDVVVFMKGTPDFPMCGFSGRVVQIFRHLLKGSGREVHGVNVLEDESIRNGVKVYANWPTIPQVFVKGEFIGGCDITVEMAQSGELQKMLQEKLGVALTTP